MTSKYKQNPEVNKTFEFYLFGLNIFRCILKKYFRGTYLSKTLVALRGENKKRKGFFNENFIFPELYSSKATRNIYFAGLLTYFRLVWPSHLYDSGIAVIQALYRSLQQRVCSGFTPDSHLILSFGMKDAEQSMANVSIKNGKKQCIW